MREDCSRLDVASGKGTTAVFLPKEFGREVVVIDYGERRVLAARSLAQAEHVDSPSWLGGNTQFCTNQSVS